MNHYQATIDHADLGRVFHVFGTSRIDAARTAARNLVARLPEAERTLAAEERFFRYLWEDETTTVGPYTAHLTEWTARR